MNKTVTANISGVVFHIESSAYDNLHNYLNTIRTYFKDSEGKDEIMADIEARIAELFKEHLDEGKEVITAEHVRQVISVMGEPEQYMDEVDAEDLGSGRSSSKKEAFYSKKLYRDPDESVLGGVCSGIGHYFGVDKIWLRAVFLIALIFFGTGVLLYIILWIIIPSAKTTTEKLEMKGEPVTVDNIGNAIKDEFGNFKKKVSDGNVKYRNRAEHAIYRFFEFIGRILLFLFKFIVKVIAVLLVLVGISGLIGVIAILIGGPVNMSFDDNSVETYWLSDISDLIFASDFMYAMGLIGLCLVMTIPLLGILYGGIKILFDIPRTNRAVGLTALSLWAIGIILLVIASTNTASQFASRQTIEEEIVLSDLNSDTLILARMGNTYGEDGFGGSIFLEDGMIKTNDLSINVVRSKNDKVRMLVDKSSKGRVRKEAGRRAENILLGYELENNRLEVSPLIEVPLEDKYRKQEVEISIALPNGKSIYLDPTARDIIYDIKNITNTYDGRMMGHHWLMTEEGLQCTDCAWLEAENQAQTEQNLLEEAERLKEEAETQARKARELKRKAEKLREAEAANDAELDSEL